MNGQKKNQTLDAAQKQRDIYWILDDDPDWKSKRMLEEIGDNESLSDALQKSPNLPNRTLQAGSDPVQVIGLKLKRKDLILHVHKLMRT